MSTVKTLSGRELEIIKEASEKVALAKQHMEASQVAYLESNNYLNALFEMATGQGPEGLSLDMDTGIISSEKTVTNRLNSGKASAKR